MSTFSRTKTRRSRMSQKMESLEINLWEKEQAKAALKMKKKNITDEDIDRLVMRRRREVRR